MEKNICKIAVAVNFYFSPAAAFGKLLKNRRPMSFYLRTIAEYIIM